MSVKYQGFILVMTLLMLFVISMLVMTCLQEVWLYHQAMNSRAEQHQSFYHMERIAMELAKSDLLDIKGNCVIDGDQANHIWQTLKEHHGCSINVEQSQFKYLVEDLGDYPCLVALVNHQEFMTHHHRVSVFSESGEKSTSLLQVRVINPASTKVCSQEPLSVKLGVSSWRYLIKIV